jgi:hypothetical protein
MDRDTLVKLCACGRGYASAEWRALRRVPSTHLGQKIELRICDCGSTLAIFVDRHGEPIQFGEEPAAEAAAANTGVRSPQSVVRLSDQELGSEPILAALVRCEHFEEIAGVIVEPDGSHYDVSWCGACGALRVPGVVADDWMAPALLHHLRQDDRPTRLAVGVVELVRRLTAMLPLARAGLADRQETTQLKEGVLEVEVLCKEVEGLARVVLGEVRFWGPLRHASASGTIALALEAFGDAALGDSARRGGGKSQPTEGAPFGLDRPAR